MTNADRGIEKRVSEPVYPADILADTAIRLCGPVARCCWYETLFRLWRDDCADLTAKAEDLARVWGVTDSEACAAIAELDEKKVCRVTQRHGFVTLTSRRLERRKKSQEQARKRKQAQRERERDTPCHAAVPDEKAASSSSSSVSSSVSGYGNRNRIERSGSMHCWETSTIYDPDLDPVEIAIDVCEEAKPDLARGFYRRALKAIGDKAMRDLIAETNSELKAGELKNPGAILSGKLKRAMNARG